ncbi:MAG: hypothetical protein J7J61_05495 [Candidatus Hydrothermae bacterium]|nr:hypothetical protein [Candidatus Hydrothermae bacterium]
MREVKLVCTFDECYEWTDNEIPLDVCLRCGELRVVRREEGGDSMGEVEERLKELDKNVLKVARCVFDLLDSELSEKEQEEFKACLRKLNALLYFVKRVAKVKF